MFADMELIGIPMRLVISDKGLGNGMIEYKGRTDESSQDVARGDIIEFVKQKLER